VSDASNIVIIKSFWKVHCSLTCLLNDVSGTAFEGRWGDVDAQPVAVGGTRKSSARNRETTQESGVWVSECKVINILL